MEHFERTCRVKNRLGRKRCHKRRPRGYAAVLPHPFGYLFGVISLDPSEYKTQSYANECCWPCRWGNDCHEPVFSNNRYIDDTHKQALRNHSNTRVYSKVRCGPSPRSQAFARRRYYQRKALNATNRFHHETMLNRSIRRHLHWPWRRSRACTRSSTLH